MHPGPDEKSKSSNVDTKSIRSSISVSSSATTTTNTSAPTLRPRRRSHHKNHRESTQNHYDNADFDFQFNANFWTTQEVCEWLCNNRHGVFASIFWKNEISGTSLLMMSPSMLDMMGVYHSPARIRLLIDLAALQRSHMSLSRTSRSSSVGQNMSTQMYHHKVVPNNANPKQRHSSVYNVEDDKLTLESQHSAWEAFHRNHAHLQLDPHMRLQQPQLPQQKFRIRRHVPSMGYHIYDNRPIYDNKPPYISPPQFIEDDHQVSEPSATIYDNIQHFDNGPVTVEDISAHRHHDHDPSNTHHHHDSNSGRSEEYSDSKDHRFINSMDRAMGDLSMFDKVATHFDHLKEREPYSIHRADNEDDVQEEDTYIRVDPPDSLHKRNSWCFEQTDSMANSPNDVPFVNEHNNGNTHNSTTTTNYNTNNHLLDNASGGNIHSHDSNLTTVFPTVCPTVEKLVTVKIQRHSTKDALGVRFWGGSDLRNKHGMTSVATVESTLPGSPAHDKLLPGDIIVEVEGRSTCNLSHAEVKELLLALKGEFVLIVKRHVALIGKPQQGHVPPFVHQQDDKGPFKNQQNQKNHRNKIEKTVVNDSQKLSPSQYEYEDAVLVATSTRSRREYDDVMKSARLNGTYKTATSQTTRSFTTDDDPSRTSINLSIGTKPVSRGKHPASAFVYHADHLPDDETGVEKFYPFQHQTHDFLYDRYHIQGAQSHGQEHHRPSRSQLSTPSTLSPDITDSIISPIDVPEITGHKQSRHRIELDNVGTHYARGRDVTQANSILNHNHHNIHLRDSPTSSRLDSSLLEKLEAYGSQRLSDQEKKSLIDGLQSVCNELLNHDGDDHPGNHLYDNQDNLDTPQQMTKYLR